MQTLVIQSIESALAALGDLIRPSKHATVTTQPHVPGQLPAKVSTQSDANTVITVASSDDFPGTSIEITDCQIIDVLPSSDRPTGSYYLVDDKTYVTINSKRYMVGSQIAMYQHLARPTTPVGFSWA